MRSILLGSHSETGEPIRIPRSAFETHFHLIGGTGKGKTTAIHTLLKPLLLDPLDQSCVILFDRLGGLSQELLLWMASDFCNEDVRRRLIYIEAANEEAIVGFNPLLYSTEAEGYYKVQRATEIILRAWESVDLAAMPRLARWTFNAFWAVAQLGLTIADSAHLLMPRSDFHRPLLQCLPQGLRAEWAEITEARGTKAIELLDSSRNRLKPYYESSILRRMFGSERSGLDVERFMREGRIVVLNLAPMGRIPTQVSDAIGAMVLNEVLATARSLGGQGIVYPTYLLLDEFQNFVGPDIESALPEVRQLGLRLMLSHQSLSQLERGDYDLRNMIFQAQSRMVFGIQGPDADEIANELASLDFDPRRVKEENWVRRQRQAGFRVVELSSWSNSRTESENWGKTYGETRGHHENRTHGILRDTLADGTSHTDQQGNQSGGGSATGATQGRAEHMMPILEDYDELASRSFYSFMEQRSLWAQKVRKLKKGKCVLRLVDDDTLHPVDVKLSKIGYLAWEYPRLVRELPEVIDALARLKEENFRSDVFSSKEQIDREMAARLERVVNPAIVLQSASGEAPPSAPRFD